ncbi:MAG: sialidase family protein [Acidobacteria bacterium]|nr:sialidase family protein [Acidobacteriota bacterium]
MKVLERGLIYDASARPAHQRIAFFTGLCVLRSGAILSAFQVGSAKHSTDSTLRVCRSVDGGRTWSDLPSQFETTRGGVPGSMSAPALVETEPGRLLLVATWFDRRDPARPLFDPVTEGILHSSILLSESSDDGATWSDWRELPTPGLAGCSTTGPIVRWPDGTLACAFESFKAYDDPRPGRHAAWLVVSQDGGRTFSEPQLVAQHPEHKVYYWDQRLCAGTTAGEFIALFWTHDLEQKQDRTVSFRRGWLDDGHLRTEPLHDTTIPGQISAPLLLNDGRLLAFVVDRNRPGTMTLWCSHDGGLTWPSPDRLVVHVHDERGAISQGSENIDFKQYWEDMGKWSFGHPALVPIGENTVIAAFYAGTPDAMSVHWVRVDVR